MDEGTYQFVALGIIGMAGLGISKYLDVQRKQMTNYFVSRFQELVEQSKDLTNKLEVSL